MLDRQAIFDQVRKHFLVDGNPPGFDSDESVCTYAGPPCAIGIFDTEGVLRYRRETVVGIPPNILKKVFPDFEPVSVFRSDSDIAFLRELQRAHDRSCDVTEDDPFLEGLEWRLRGVARDFELEWKE